jgi:hypothetical protein
MLTAVASAVFEMHLAAVPLRLIEAVDDLPVAVLMSAKEIAPLGVNAIT